MDPTLDKVIQTPRFVARRRAVRNAERRRRRRIVASIVCLAIAVVGAVALSRSLLFQLESITVVGARGVSETEVIRASGLRPGQSALGIDLEAAAAAIEALPAVDSARVERVGSLGVRIVVLERSAAVEVRANGRRWYLDDEGFTVDAGTRRKLPVIIAPSAPGVGVMLPAGTVDAVLTVWTAMPPALRRGVGGFTVPADGMIRFRVGEATVLFGSLDQLEQKIQALMLVRRRVAEDGTTLLAVDVTAPEHPAARIG